MIVPLDQVFCLHSVSASFQTANLTEPVGHAKSIVELRHAAHVFYLQLLNKLAGPDVESLKDATARRSNHGNICSVRNGHASSITEHPFRNNCVRPYKLWC